MSTPSATSLIVVSVPASFAKKKTSAPPQKEEISETNAKLIFSDAAYN